MSWEIELDQIVGPAKGCAKDPVVLWMEFQYISLFSVVREKDFGRGERRVSTEWNFRLWREPTKGPLIAW